MPAVSSSFPLPSPPITPSSLQRSASRPRSTTPISTPTVRSVWISWGTNGVQRWPSRKVRFLLIKQPSHSSFTFLSGVLTSDYSPLVDLFNADWSQPRWSSRSWYRSPVQDGPFQVRGDCSGMDKEVSFYVNCFRIHPVPISLSFYLFHTSWESGY